MEKVLADINKIIIDKNLVQALLYLPLKELGTEVINENTKNHITFNNSFAVTAFFSIFIVKEINQAIVLQFGDQKELF